MTLLVAAGLVERSVDAARSADYGFAAAGVVSVRLDLRPNGYDEARGLAFYTELLGAVRASAGIESVTLANATPLTLVDDGARKVTVEGYEPRTGEDMTFLSNIVAPDYFPTLKIGVLAGREFTRPDDAGAIPVAIVNGTLAERFWGGASQAIGKRLQVQAGEWRTVVGVVRDIKYSRINEARRPYVYLPFLQFYDPMMLVHARGSVGTAALLDTLRRQIQMRDPELPILGARTLTEQTQSALAFLDMAAVCRSRLASPASRSQRWASTGSSPTASRRVRRRLASGWPWVRDGAKWCGITCAEGCASVRSAPPWGLSPRSPRRAFWAACSTASAPRTSRRSPWPWRSCSAP
jgi:hypothetical protein